MQRIFPYLEAAGPADREGPAAQLVFPHLVEVNAANHAGPAARHGHGCPHLEETAAAGH